MAPDNKWFLDYDTALDRVMSLPDFERSKKTPDHASFHLERIGLLLNCLDNPHLAVPTVHIAGTKGKGSTAAMVASILMAQGYTVGLYTSPHLHRVVERIRIGLEPISRDTFAKLVARVWSSVEHVGKHGPFGPVSFFEIMTAMAFLYFRQMRVDLQIIEVGLGGRLDATNVVNPVVSVITSISLDHTSTLGNTLTLIAAEKAGIIKPHIPVVVAPQKVEVLDEIRRIADNKCSEITVVGEDVIANPEEYGPTGQSMKVAGNLRDYDLWIPLIGDHQIHNAATAIATAEALELKGFSITREGVVEGLRRTEWPARLQVISCNDTLVIADGAHNPDSMRRLVQAVKKYFEFECVTVIFGTIGGHSIQGMLAELKVLSPLVVSVQSRHPKSSSIEHISTLALEMGIQVIDQSNSVALATRTALGKMRDRDLILATGSLSVTAEFIEEIEGIKPELYPNLKRSL